MSEHAQPAAQELKKHGDVLDTAVKGSDAEQKTESKRQESTQPQGNAASGDKSSTE